MQWCMEWVGGGGVQWAIWVACLEAAVAWGSTCRELGVAVEEEEKGSSQECLDRQVRQAQAEAQAQVEGQEGRQERRERRQLVRPWLRGPLPRLLLPHQLLPTTGRSQRRCLRPLARRIPRSLPSSTRRLVSQRALLS